MPPILVVVPPPLTVELGIKDLSNCEHSVALSSSFKEMNLIHDTVARVGQEVTFLCDAFHCLH